VRILATTKHSRWGFTSVDHASNQYIYIYIYMSFAQDTVVDVKQFLTLVSTALAEIALGSPKTPNSLPPPGNWAQLQLK